MIKFLKKYFFRKKAHLEKQDRILEAAQRKLAQVNDALGIKTNKPKSSKQSEEMPKNPNMSGKDNTSKDLSLYKPFI